MNKDFHHPSQVVDVEDSNDTVVNNDSDDERSEDEPTHSHDLVHHHHQHHTGRPYESGHTLTLTPALPLVHDTTAKNPNDEFVIPSATPTELPVQEEEPKLETLPSEPQHISVLEWAKIILLIACGVGEGIAMYLSGVSYPPSIRRQFSFDNFIVFKVFFSAIGASMIFQAIGRATNPSRFDETRVYRTATSGMARIFLGATLGGAGMSLAGSGATMLPVQLGPGFYWCFLTFAGAVVGTALFEATSHHIPHMKFAFEERITTVDDHFTKLPYGVISALGGIVCMGGAGLVEYLRPHHDDCHDLGIKNVLNPIFAGVVIGFNQLPMRYISWAGQGGTRAFVVLVTTLTGGLIGHKDSMLNFKTPWNWHQFSFLFFGLIGGSAIACFCVERVAPQDYSFESPAAPFFGGLIMLFGGKMSGGCTCGRNITGFSELSVQSILSTAFIFVGGIPVAFLMKLA
eukprot:PhF_6_TR27878/c1_g1_i2/m.40800